jgi:LmbE family N-acetylglucosaminyl deacetylase
MFADLAGVAVLALLVLAVVLWRVRLRLSRALFRIPSRRTDACPCRRDRATLAVRLESDGFQIPEAWAGFRGTAFLSLVVAAPGAGSIADPFIEVTHAGGRYRQYFERSATGRRYLNVSPVFAGRNGAGERSVTMHGHRIRWHSDASLVLFDPPHLDEASVLVLAPHPDDAEIAAFGIYSTHRAWIATVTAGERGMSSAVGAGAGTQNAESRWGADLRVWDSLYIPAVGHVPTQRCVNLVNPDGQLKAMHSAPTRTFRIACEDALRREELRERNLWPSFRRAGAECSWPELVKEIGQLLDETMPSVVICPHPLLDSHPDHVFTAVALAEALRGGSHRPEICLMYVVHPPGTSLYPFGPADSVVSIPPGEHMQWLADSLYSHPVAEDTRQGKYFAVEAAHGLRVFAADGPLTVRDGLRRLRKEFKSLIGGHGLNPESFLRRSPRPNELYYLVSVDGFAELTQRALSQ